MGIVLTLWYEVMFCAPNLAGWEKSCIFAGRNKSGIRYDLPKVRAVAYRFSTTYLLRSAASLRVEIGMREHRQQDSLDFHPFLLCLNDCDAILHFVVCPPYYANHQFDFADAWQIVSHPQEFVELLLVPVFWFGFDFAILFRHSQDGIQLEYRQSGKVTFRSLMTCLVNGDKPNIDVVFQSKVVPFL